MRLQFKDGTIVESDSPKELADFYRELAQVQTDEGGKTSTTNGNRPTVVRAATNEAIPKHAEQLLCILYPAADGLPTNKIAKELNVEGKAVGGYVTSLTRWAERNQLGTKKQLLTKERRLENGEKVRTMKLTPYFRKLITDGKIRGFMGA